MKIPGKYFETWATDPVRLQEYIWFSICFYFGRREGYCEMMKDTSELRSDDNGREYVTCVLTEKAKNFQGGHKQTDQDYSDCRMYATSPYC